MREETVENADMTTAVWISSPDPAALQEEVCNEILKEANDAIIMSLAVCWVFCEWPQDVLLLPVIINGMVHFVGLWSADHFRPTFLERPRMQFVTIYSSNKRQRYEAVFEFN